MSLLWPARRWDVALLLTALLVGQVPADETNAPALPADSDATAAAAVPTDPHEHSPLLAWRDARYVFSAPFRWGEEDWLYFAGAAALVGGTAAGLDRPTRDYVRDHRSAALDRGALTFQRFGAEYSFGVLGAFWLAGWATDSPRALDTAYDGAVASLLASGVITPILKRGVGRARPNADKGAYSFSPFGSDASFPSGHTTQAFAVAVDIADHYDSLWVQIPAYCTAVLVGLARIEQNSHYASDVVAGAIIGTTVSKAVTHFNRGGQSGLAIVPVVDSDGRGLAVSLDF